MKYRKVYGINGLLEWHGYVESGGLKMKVDFTNGSVTAFGVAPATFATQNELTQHIIENSDMFKNGRIRIVMKAELPEEKTQTPSSTPTKVESAKIEEAPKEEKLEIAENIEEAPAEETPVVETPTVETVEVTCNDDAKDYMAEKFGVARSKMRSREQIEKVAKEYGVVFDWK